MHKTLLTLSLGSLVLTAQAHAAENKLYLFNWSEYMDPGIIEAFEERYDAEVVQNYFNSNPEMFAKLSAGGTSQYDIIVPSNYYIPRLIETGMVQEIDATRLDNLGNIMERFRDPVYDPGGHYSVPYQWGATGIVYNTETFPEAPKSWSLLFDPGINSEHPFALMKDGQVTMEAACAYLGHGFDCTGTEAWRGTARLLLETKRRENFSGFIDGVPMVQQLARGVVHVGMTYNGALPFYQMDNPELYDKLAFMIPDEGAEIWVDAMMIPTEAPNPDLAYKFIDFILEAEIGAKLSNYNYYASPNAAARPYLDEALTVPPVLPREEDMERLHFTPPLEGSQLQTFQQLWNDVKAY